MAHHFYPCVVWETSVLLIEYMSRDMTKPTKWVCAQRRLRSAWAFGCAGWSESSLGAYSFCWFVMSWLNYDVTRISQLVLRHDLILTAHVWDNFAEASLHHCLIFSTILTKYQNKVVHVIFFCLTTVKPRQTCATLGRITSKNSWNHMIWTVS